MKIKAKELLKKFDEASGDSLNAAKKVDNPTNNDNDPKKKKKFF